MCIVLSVPYINPLNGVAADLTMIIWKTTPMAIPWTGVDESRYAFGSRADFRLFHAAINRWRNSLSS